jgi:hypothetical protein
MKDYILWIREKLNGTFLQQKSFDDDYKVEELKYKDKNSIKFLYVLYRYDRELQYITTNIIIPLDTAYDKLYNENMEKTKDIPIDEEDYMQRWK